MSRFGRQSSAVILIQISLYLLIAGIAMPFPAVTTKAAAQPLNNFGSDCSVSALNQTAIQLPLTSVVPGTVPSVVRSKTVPEVGAVSDSFLMNMELVFKIRNRDQFLKCLTAISDPSSAEYRHFLNATTLTQFIQTPSEELAVTNFLTAQGLTVTRGASPLVLNIAGSAAVVQKALKVQIKLYKSLIGHAFYSTDTDPTLQQGFASGIESLTGLSNYTLIQPADVPGPCYTSYCAQAVETGYSMNSLYSNGINGNGVTVAVIAAAGDPNPTSALHQYDVQYGLPDPTFHVFCGSGNTWGSCGSISYDPGWASEAAMDIEAVHAMAPGAAIDLFYVPPTSPVDAIDYIATNHIAQVVSNSWTFICGSPCSDAQLAAYIGSGAVNSIDARLALDAAQGLTIVFATGDEGAKPDGSTLGTEFPASDPNVLAVGATNLALTGCGATTCTGYGSETGASISGGGFSGYFSEPNWQTSTIGVESGRAVPDVSMLGYAPMFWVYSTASDHCGRGGDSPGWFSCAGTSLSTPLWAGVLAVLVQYNGGMELGNVDLLIYLRASSSRYSVDFHDVTSGANGGYSAGVGWDAVTGWGTPIVDGLAQDMPHEKLMLTNSGSISLGQGTSNSTQIGVTLLGPARTVTLSCGSGMPSLAICSFSPSSGVGNYSSTLTLVTEPSTPSGVYNITVIGTTNVVANSTSFTLQVGERQQSCQTTSVPSVYNCPLTFVQGWNLVSLPVVPVANSTFPNTVAGIFGSNVTFGFLGSVSAVFTYSSGVWQFCSVNMQASGINGQYVCAGSLSSMVDGKGYWVYAKQAFTLNNANVKRPTWGGLLGSVIPAGSSPPGYVLTAGWNLIGYKPEPNVTANENVTAYLQSVNGDYDARNVWVYDNANQSWIRANSAYLLQPGQGIWILMTTPATLRP